MYDFYTKDWKALLRGILQDLIKLKDLLCCHGEEDLIIWKCQVFPNGSIGSMIFPSEKNMCECVCVCCTRANVWERELICCSNIYMRKTKNSQNNLEK